LLVLLLAGMVVGSSLVQPLAGMLGSPPQAYLPPFEELPPVEQALATQPPADGAEAQQNGEPQAGENGGEPSGEPSPGENQQTQEGQSGDSPGSGQTDPQALEDALRELGRQLDDQAPTYDLGQALEQLDLEGGAEALESLADQLDQLSPETREQFADELEQAAGDVEAAGEPSLAEDLRDAAEALRGEAVEDQPSPDSESPSGPVAGEPLDELAQDLRELAQGMEPGQAGGGGAGNSPSAQTGSPEPTGRLQGEGGELELPLDDSSQSGLLSPAPPHASGSGTASGSLDSLAGPGSDAAQSPLLPTTYLWKWRDVVSKYFER
jgi:hypothetical protein